MDLFEFEEAVKFTNKNFRIFDGATLRRRPIFLNKINKC